MQAQDGSARAAKSRQDADLPAAIRGGGGAMIPLGSAPRNQWRVSAAAVDLVRPSASPRPLAFPAEPQNLTLDLGRTALLVIDMQNDFCHPEGWLASLRVDVAPARRPIAPLARLVPALRRAGVPVLWINWGNRPDRPNLSPSLLHVYKPTGEGIGLGDPLPKSGAPVLEAGGWGPGRGHGLRIPPRPPAGAENRLFRFLGKPRGCNLRHLCATQLRIA